LGAVDTGGHDVAQSLEELRELAAAAGAQVIAVTTQNREAPDSASYFGSGKLEEIKETCAANEIDLLICDDELSPAQLRNLEDALELRVIDRTMLILDIFAARAHSSEGKLQVELAQLKYTLPRLRGQGRGLSRLGGGIGTRGPGETKLESDRRHIRSRMHRLEGQLQALAQRRALQRGRRKKTGVETVAIVGYTNAGKSTLLNALTQAGVLAEDKLFATLDPTARALALPDGRRVMLVDTVGFLRRLPHHLVEAFHSTLEEAAAATLILNVCDISSPDCAEQLQVTAEQLQQLKAEAPVLQVHNKCDLAPPEVLSMPVLGGGVQISALHGTGLTELLEKIAQALPPRNKTLRFCLPYGIPQLAARIRAEGSVQSEEFAPQGVVMEASVPFYLAEELQSYLLEGV
jgi:GTP-binding protein HflX